MKYNGVMCEKDIATAADCLMHLGNARVKGGQDTFYPLLRRADQKSDIIPGFS